MEKHPSHYPTLPVLLVDDDHLILRVISVSLRSEGVDNVVLCDDSRKVMDLLAAKEFSVVTLDLSMPHVSGKELLKEITQKHPGLTVIVVTAHYDVETAMECVKLGAFDYIQKKTEGNDLVPRILRAIQHTELVEENIRLKRSLLSDAPGRPEAFAAILTSNKAMLNIFRYAEAVAKTNFTMLIVGETGVGKELLTEAIHKASGRSGQFVTVNTAGLDDNIFSDTLFGHEKSAFTGADRRRPGLVETAADGTLFLDEIGDLSHESQVKLLRFLQDGKYYPVGADSPRLSTARVVTATNQNLNDAVAKGSFRKDLFFRLQAHQIVIPPLRERPDDIALLAEHFYQKASSAASQPPQTSLDELVTALARHDFPGNVRELQGIVTNAVFAADAAQSAIKRQAAAPSGTQTATTPAIDEASSHGVSFPARLPPLREWEDRLIAEAMRRTGGNKSLAASMLGISRQALHNRLKDLGKATATE